MSKLLMTLFCNVTVKVTMLRKKMFLGCDVNASKMAYLTESSLMKKKHSE